MYTCVVGDYRTCNAGRSLTDSGQKLDADEDGRFVVPATAVHQLAVRAKRETSHEHEIQQLFDAQQVRFRHARVVRCTSMSHCRR